MLGEAVGRVRRVELVHSYCGEGVPGDLLLPRRNYFTGKAFRSE